MSRNGTGYFVGPSRAKWMTWLVDLIGMQDLNRAHAEAYLKDIYGEGFSPPKRRKMKVAGGSIGDRYEDRKSLPFCGPKSSIGPWLFASVALVILAAAGVAWFGSFPRPAQPAPAPNPAQQANSEQPYLKIGGGGPRQ